MEPFTAITSVDVDCKISTNIVAGTSTWDSSYLKHDVVAALVCCRVMQTPVGARGKWTNCSDRSCLLVVRHAPLIVSLRLALKRVQPLARVRSDQSRCSRASDKITFYTLQRACFQDLYIASSTTARLRCSKDTSNISRTSVRPR